MRQQKSADKYNSRDKLSQLSEKIKNYYFMPCQSEPDTEIYIISMMADRCRKGVNMQEKQHKSIQMETALCVRLLKMLLCSKVINQPTYDKVIKRYKGKEVA